MLVPYAPLTPFASRTVACLMPVASGAFHRGAGAEMGYLRVSVPQSCQACQDVPNCLSGSRSLLHTDVKDEFAAWHVLDDGVISAGLHELLVSSTSSTRSVSTHLGLHAAAVRVLLEQRHEFLIGLHSYRSVSHSSDVSSVSPSEVSFCTTP